MQDILRNLWTDEEGATIVEYVLLLAVIALGVLVAMQTLRGSITNKYTETSNKVADPNSN